MVAETVGGSGQRRSRYFTLETHVTPFDPGAFALRQSDVAAPALRSAARSLKEKIIAHAAVMLHQLAYESDHRKGHIVLVERPEAVNVVKRFGDGRFGPPANAAGSSSLKAPSKPPLTHRRLAVPLLIRRSILRCAKSSLLYPQRS